MGFFDSLDGNVNEIMENLNYLKKKIVSESQGIKRHKARLSSLKMGLDASDSSGTIFKSDSKKDLDKNFQKSDFSGLYVEKDIEENNLERDEGSIIFIEEDEDENR